MQIDFTDQEKKYLGITLSDNGYIFYCKEGAPLFVKESIERKINAHKMWLKEASNNVYKKE